jgi:hypothetical protein
MAQKEFLNKNKEKQPLGHQLKISIKKANFGLSHILGSIVPSLVT